MEKTKITVPEGYGVGKIEVVDGEVVVTFKAKEPQLPRTWDEFCKCNKVKVGECAIDFLSNIIEEDKEVVRNPITMRKELPNRETAEAVLALCQLIQLRECYNQGWQPDWKDESEKFIIVFKSGEIKSDCWCTCAYTPLYFKTDELRDLFLENFRELIEKLKPLYGIMKGGEE